MAMETEAVAAVASVTAAEVATGNSGDKQQTTSKQQSTTCDGDGPTTTTTRANNDNKYGKYDKLSLTTLASSRCPPMRTRHPDND